MPKLYIVVLGVIATIAIIYWISLTFGVISPTYNIFKRYKNSSCPVVKLGNVFQVVVENSDFQFVSANIYSFCSHYVDLDGYLDYINGHRKNIDECYLLVFKLSASGATFSYYGGGLGSSIYPYSFFIDDMRVTSKYGYMLLKKRLNDSISEMLKDRLAKKMRDLERGLYNSKSFE